MAKTSASKIKPSKQIKKVGKKAISKVKTAKKTATKKAAVKNVTVKPFKMKQLTNSKLPAFYTLNDGSKLPSMGFGSGGVQDEDSIYNAIMKVGYVHIDTAFVYGNEEVIGQALKRCFKDGKKREDIYVTTKIPHTKFNDVQGTIEESLKKLGLAYVDLYLIHGPLGALCTPMCPMHKVWPQMEKLVAKGLTRSIGLSNCTVQMIWDLLCYCKIKPVVNQVELNPQCTQLELVRFCLAHDIRPVAYTPVARPGGQFTPNNRLCPDDWPDLRQEPVLQKIAKKYKKTVVQVMLNWGICRGHAVIPKAQSPKYQKENMDIFDFKLTDKEVESINTLNTGRRLCVKLAKFGDGFDVFA